MAIIKYSISVVKRDPLLKIKVTGIYNEKDQDIYYRNPVTGSWERIQGEVAEEGAGANQGLSLEFLKNITCRLKHLADRFYEDSKELFGGAVREVRRSP